VARRPAAEAIVILQYWWWLVGDDVPRLPVTRCERPPVTQHVVSWGEQNNKRTVSDQVVHAKPDEQRVQGEAERCSGSSLYVVTQARAPERGVSVAPGPSQISHEVSLDGQDDLGHVSRDGRYMCKPDEKRLEADSKSEYGKADEAERCQPFPVFRRHSRDPARLPVAAPFSRLRWLCCEHGFQTRGDWHGVYMDLNVFAEYAANNPSSALIFIWHWKRQHLGDSVIQAVAGVASERLLASTFRLRPSRSVIALPATSQMQSHLRLA